VPTEVYDEAGKLVWQMKLDMLFGRYVEIGI